MAEKKRGTGLAKKCIYWILILAVLYILTSARTAEEAAGQKEAGQKTIVVEKLVNVTRYREEKVPYGTPRCEMFTYNFTKTYSYSESSADGKKTAICRFTVKNEEDVSGNFSFYAQLVKNTGLTEGKDLLKPIEAFGTETFEWTFNIESNEQGSCLLQSSNYPHRMRCFYLEPITYEIKKVPYTSEELKNVTEQAAAAKESAAKSMYVNRFFGYRQFFYFGY